MSHRQWVRKLLILSAVCLGGLALAFGQAGGDSRSSGGDGAGRIVSLSPATTEWLYAWGMGAAVVGRTEACDHPPEAAQRPSVGAFLEPNIAAILQLKPDLVLVTSDFNPRRVAELTRQVGDVFRLDTSSLEGWHHSLLALAKRLGVPAHNLGPLKTLSAWPPADALHARASGAKDLGYVAWIDQQESFVATKSSLVGAFLERAGLRNLVDIKQPYPQVSPRYVSSLEPKVVVVFGNSREDVGDLAGPLVPTPAEMRFIKDAWPRLQPWVIKLDGDVFLRPGPRLMTEGWVHIVGRVQALQARHGP
jgi:iron complex transport system substrate-binding protein